jgi:hypothetical protein
MQHRDCRGYGREHPAATWRLQMRSEVANSDAGQIRIAYHRLDYRPAFLATERPMPDQSMSSPSLAIVCSR